MGKGARRPRRRDRLFFTDWYNRQKTEVLPWPKALFVPIIILVAIYLFLFGYIIFLLSRGAPEAQIRIITIAIVLVALAIGFGVVIKIFRNNEKLLLDGKERESFERKYLVTIINNLTDAILALDKNGRILFYNAASLDILNTNQSLTGVSIANLLKLHNQNGTRIKIWDEIKEDRRILSRDDLILSQGDDKINLELMSSPIIGDGEIPFGFVLMLRNITEEKSLEESKDEFIAVTGHELRTPIAVAEGSVSNLKVLLKKGNPSPEVLEKTVEAADTQIKLLAKIANNLLTLSRLDRGIKVPKETFDINEFAEETIAKYRAQAEEKGLSLRAEVPVDIGNIETIKLYLSEILQNFITNAIKYTEKGEIVLKIINGDGFVEFDVIDTGIGISKDDLNNVFDKFYRSEDYRTRKSGGTGLGLYIVRRLADVMRSKIVFESEINKGSTFGVQIRRRDWQ